MKKFTEKNENENFQNEELRKELEQQELIKKMKP